MSGDYGDFVARLSMILRRDRRYKEDAYVFVMAALSRAIDSLSAPRHVTGQELLQWVQKEAEHQFGPMAATVFDHWGVKNSLDFGHIVFNMVQEGVLSKTDTDTLDDFKDAVFFQNLFDDAAGYRLHDEEIQLKDVSKQKNGA